MGNLGRTTHDGVFTAAQAEPGSAEYGRYCARCHGPDLDGIGAAPMLYSSRFLDRWREDSLRTLFDYVKMNMPQDGKLNAQLSRRVQVKGVLNGEGTAARVSVLSFQSLKQDCQ